MHFFREKNGEKMFFEKKKSIYLFPHLLSHNMGHAAIIVYIDKLPICFIEPDDN